MNKKRGLKAVSGWMLSMGFVSYAGAAMVAVVESPVNPASVLSISSRFDPSQIQTFSPRLDSLQLSVSVQDETNVIGLDKYGSNPAGIIHDEEKSRVAAGFFDQDLDISFKNGDHQSQTAFSPAFLGVYRDDQNAVRVNLAQQKSRNSYAGTNDQKGTDRIGSLAYNHRFSDLLLGVDVGASSIKSEEGGVSQTFKSDPMSLNLGVGYQGLANGQVTLGGNFSSDKRSVGNDQTDTSNNGGFQSIYSPNKSITLGFVVSYLYEMTESKPHQNKTWIKAPMAALRGFYQSPTLPFQMGAKLTAVKMTVDDEISGESVYNLDYKGIDGNVGAAWAKAGLGLVGLEADFYRDRSKATSAGTLLDVSSDLDLDYDKTALGGEFELFPMFLLRASVSYTSYKHERTTDTLAFGGGVGARLGEKGKLDLSYIDQKLKASSAVTGSDDRQLKVLGTWYF